MAPSSFRRAAVVCSIVTASLGLGLLTPVTASATTTAAPAASNSTTSNPDFDTIPVDPAMGAPRFMQNWSTPFGSRTVVGVSPDAEEVWLVIGNTAHDRRPAPVFFLNVQDRHKDEQLELISIRTAADGSKVRSERVPMPRATEVTGAEAQNSFTPGTNHFSGSATPGATVVATDTLTDTELFTAEVSDARTGVGTWSADATLDAGTDYSVTFTQTAKDGRTHQLRGVEYSPTDSDTPTEPAPDPAEGNAELAGIPIDPSIDAPTLMKDWILPDGSRSLVGVTGDDALLMMHGTQVVDRHLGGRELFFMEGKDPQSDQPIELVRVHTAADGTKTRSGRIPMARSVHAAGVGAQNHFAPGVREFSGTAEPGASIVARDHAQDKTLFSTEVSESADGTGSWSAETELDAETAYTISFTQTTKDGRTNELRGVSFFPEGTDLPAPPPGDPELDSIPVDSSIGEPEFYRDWVTPGHSRTVLGNAGDDDLYMVVGTEVLDRNIPGALVVLTLSDRYVDRTVELIRVRTAADGTQTRGERIPLPRSVQVDGLEEQNTFAPGKREFTGTATAGATIVATDTKTGRTLFSTEVSSTKTEAGTWSAAAEFAAGTDYTVTFTQTTKDGRTTELPDIAFSPEDSDAPAAPTIETTERRLDGSFVLSGAPVSAPETVVIEDEAGKEISGATLSETGWAATVPQDLLGSTVYAVTRSEAGTPSVRTPVPLTQLPTDASVTQPTLRDVVVHPDGRVQVVGERDEAPALWILDGERVVAGVPHGEVWSYVIPAEETGKQLDIVNLGFDGQGFSSMSERVPLPRLLEVDGIGQENTYAPGAREFSGKAEAGATITATDNRGNELFSTEATRARSGTGTWKADADLTGTDGYEVTFTQKTSDGRTSVMRDITFTPQSRPFAVTSPEAGSDQKGKTVTFTGTGTPGEIVTLHVTNFASTDVTAKVGDDGTWTTSRYLGTGAYTFLVTQQNAAGAITGEVEDFRLNNAPTSKPFAVTSPEAGSEHKGKEVTFTGTGTPNDTVTLHVTNFPSADVEVTVGSDGTWKASRFIGTGAYTFDITQRNTAEAITGTVKDFRLNQSAAGNDRPFAVTAPTAGSTFTPDTVMRFSGTGPVGARVFVDPGAGLAPVETIVGANGAWSVGKYVGNGNYRFVVTMTPNAGDPVVSDPIIVTPTR